MTRNIIMWPPCLLLILSICCFIFSTANCFLRPRVTESRDIFSFDGIWDFKLAPRTDPDIGMREKWWKKPRLGGGEVILMPVPSSYNDITQDAIIRDQIGVVWYQKCEFLPRRFTDSSRRVVLHFGSVNFRAAVWVDDLKVMEHVGGHLPFEKEVTLQLTKAEKRKVCVTVAVNNTLTPNTIPQGRVVQYKDKEKYPKGFVTQKLNFDFFNYAGIHRPVILYTTPFAHIKDVTILTDVDFGSDVPIGIINYELEFSGPGVGDKCSFNLIVYDENHDEVAKVESQTELNGEIKIKNPNLWWPYLSNSEDRFAYLYTIEIQLTDGNNVFPKDVYQLKVGIRSLGWDQSMQNSILINNKPLYIRGFGRHEDADIRGRGWDLAIALRDAYLMQWIGANGYRTSHYPYSEESLDIADKFGFVVIAETPAIGLSNFTARLQKKHLEITKELIDRDKNRPSVIMWSLSNEPLTQLPAADNYFKEMVQNVTMLDATRPVTFVTSQQWNNDVALPSAMWTEDFEAQALYQHFGAFDKLYKWDMLMGEMVWNFADFLTPQEIIRPTGCMKGVFTRNRQPKMAAYVLRKRYWQLAHDHCNVNFKGKNRHDFCRVRHREFNNLFEQTN
ncbi:beta-glucuronidase-like isoform X2 [Neocloeon triangulifer]|uniref:beta-glucuronidase-like isoform X2 n=1 Tax=Neocloeon triangulifer TaxID=2078957 RepID=UPI00286F871A|nr:beta-glucuronidase-like isoform X2 [Neocloeon triangulifer]